MRCAICGDGSHPTSDCPSNRDGSRNQQLTQLDAEYDSFMAELDGSPRRAAPAAAAPPADDNMLRVLFPGMRVWYEADARAAVRAQHGAFPSEPLGLRHWPPFAPIQQLPRLQSKTHSPRLSPWSPPQPTRFWWRSQR